MEVWKPVLGFENLYEVSDFGYVRRTARGKLFTAAQVQQAKEMLADGVKLKEIAAFLNTSVTTVMSIKHGKTWTGNVAYRLLKDTPINSGYRVIRLCKNSQYTQKLVHRMVWEAFNGAIPHRLEVNHKDLDKTNNRLDNLELVTHQENLIHRFSTRKRSPNRVKIQHN
ncbi:MAG: hypothetical protein EB117_13935 [Betaproteobacteria bacterium]|nr:hypothetical protein [Betaproteobacteria bacterium]